MNAEENQKCPSCGTPITKDASICSKCGADLKKNQVLVRERARADYQVQMKWIGLFFTLPLSLIGFFWKSYLGGLGARFRTGEKCSFNHGFTVFLVLGLVGLVISNIGLLWE
jgi:predicted nucleic acid-binding Zn ribbon protein